MTDPSRYARPEYTRLFGKARESLERTGGDLSRQVRVPDPTDAERRAAGGLIGRHFPPGALEMAVPLATLDAALRAKIGMGLAGFLESIGSTLRNRPEVAAKDAAARADLLAVAEASALYGTTTWFPAWVETLRRNGTFTKLIRKPREFALAVRVLEHIDGAVVSLPVLAERATRNSHALDPRRPLSGLVLSALALRAGVPRPRGTEELRDLWDRFNVLADDLSSRVLVLNVAAEGTGLGEWLTGAASFGTPFQVTLQQLVAHPIRLDHPVVHVCENVSVLREAAEKLGPGSRPLLCTEGRPSTAFHRLARMITDSGGELRYHGDFDWPGVDIAAAVISRHGAVPWRLTSADYLGAARAESEPEALDGERRPTPWDPALGDAMARTGAAIFEENVADLLVSDLRRDAPAPAARQTRSASVRLRDAGRDAPPVSSWRSPKSW